jgi:CubicO group peptidase (beta-lactamase class C family)
VTVAAIDAALARDAAAYADKWLWYQQQLQEVPAVTAAIRHGDELLLSSGYGQANLERGERVTPRHIFRVASHSKWFTATAIMRLREEGKLSLDDPLAQYIPWLPQALARVTIRQVLNHAAGITRDGYDTDFWQLEARFPDREQLQSFVEEGGSVLPSNTKLKYSNVGFSLLGMVIEAITDMPYNRYMRESIVEPLALENTGPETDAEARARMVTGYSGNSLLMPRVPLPDVETGAMAAATGFYSTAEDLTRFAAAHFLGNEELLGDESKREMQRPYWNVEGMDNYGLGMQVSKIGDRWVAGHSGGFPGHITRTFLDPEAKIAVSVLTNESGGPADQLVRGVIKLIDLAAKQKPAEDAEKLDRYTGRFAGLWGYTDIVRFGDQLFLFDPGALDPSAVAVKLEIVDEDTLKIEEKEGYGSPGEYVRYQRDDAGAIEKVINAGATEYPLGSRDDYLRQRRQELSRLRTL